MNIFTPRPNPLAGPADEDEFLRYGLRLPAEVGIPEFGGKDVRITDTWLTQVFLKIVLV